MIPNNDSYDTELDEELENDFYIEDEPSLTYAMKLNNKINKDNIFVGKIDDVEAIQQAILKMINTERYEYEIYSWDYGIELQDLLGMDMPYVMSEVKQRITDALLSDERIESVDDFKIKISGKHTLYCTFIVTTVQGEELEEEMEVKV